MGVALLLCVFSMFLFDQKLSDYFRFSSPQKFKDFARIITDLGKAEIYYLILGLVWILAWLFKSKIARNREVRRFCLVALGAMLFASSANTILKNVIGRMRPILPLDYDPMVFVPFELHYYFQSFPSGHTATVFCWLAILHKQNPRWAMIWAPVAILVGISRVAVQNHFLSDVIFGAYVGYFATMLFLVKLQPMIFGRSR